MARRKKIPTSEFTTDLENNGYHIFSRKKSVIRGFYPPGVPVNYQETDTADLRRGVRVTIRIFFLISEVPVFRVDGGYMDLEIESVEDARIQGKILTELPEHFPLAKGEMIECGTDAILHIIK